MELKPAGEAMDSRNKAQSEESRFFFVTKGFFVTGTIVRNPISCVLVFHWKPACFVCSEVRRGASDADVEWGLVWLATTGGRVRMRSVIDRLERC